MDLLNISAKFEVRSFVALPIPQVIGGTGKIWAVPGYAHAPYTLKFLKDVFD